MRLVPGLAAVLFAAAVAAQPAPPPAAGGSPAQAVPAAPALGRLFYTPQQRAALDAERRALLAQGSRPAAKPATAARPAVAEPRPVERTYTLQGIVQRSDGETTVWINNEAVHERHASRGIAAGTIARDSVAVKLPGSERRVQLRVGQSVRSGDGRARESYEGRPQPRNPDSRAPGAPPGPAGGPPGDPRS